jgi:hypothetical protein
MIYECTPQNKEVKEIKVIVHHNYMFLCVWSWTQLEAIFLKDLGQLVGGAYFCMLTSLKILC